MPSLLLAALAALAVLRLIVAGSAPLSGDEAYYRLWSLDLDWGYYDHAPMVAWWIAAGRRLTALAGLTEGEMSIRLLSPVSTFVACLMLWRAACLASGRTAAHLAVLWFAVSLAAGLGGLLATPDAPLIVFWTAALWTALEAVHRAAPGWWLLTGVFSGLALQSKYSALFLGAGLALWLLVTPTGRAQLRHWQVWAGGLVALALFAPVVAWNAGHDWVSFAKQFGRAAWSGLTPAMSAEFLAVQIAAIGLAAVFLPAGLTSLWRAAAGETRDRAALPVLVALPLLIYLLIHSLHGRVEANWAAPVHSALFIAAAHGAAGLTARWVPAVARAAVVLGLGVTALLYAQALLAPLPLPPARDPTAQLHGWEALSRDLQAAAAQSHADAVGVSVYAANGQLNWVARAGDRPVFQFNAFDRYPHEGDRLRQLMQRRVLFAVRDKDGGAATLPGGGTGLVPIGQVERRAPHGVAEVYRLWIAPAAP